METVGAHRRAPLLYVPPITIFPIYSFDLYVIFWYYFTQWNKCAPVESVKLLQARCLFHRFYLEYLN